MELFFLLYADTERDVEFRMNDFHDYCAFWGNLVSVNFQKEECRCKSVNIVFFFCMIDENSCHEIGSLDLE